jgi:hypothetical protein
MINTFKHLRQELKFNEEELKYILANLGKYYYRAESIKTKYGGPQEGNGVKKIRILYPSTGRLKEVQEKYIEIFYHGCRYLATHSEA